MDLNNFTHPLEPQLILTHPLDLAIYTPIGPEALYTPIGPEALYPPLGPEALCPPLSREAL